MSRNQVTSLILCFKVLSCIVRIVFFFQYDSENGLWEDEDTRTFYEKLEDLKERVPQVRNLKIYRTYN